MRPSECPQYEHVPPTTWASLWAKGVELLDEPTLAEMLGSETQIYAMAGDTTSNEPELYRLWAPKNDAGAQLIVQEHGHTAAGSVGRDEYNLRQRKIAAGELMVDIGSNLGAVSMRVARKSPEGHILMVEASPMTYIYQQINLWCNVPASMLQGETPQ